MMSSLAKSKVAHFQTLFSKIFLFFDVRQYSSRFDYIKTDDEQFTLRTKKIIAYHLKSQSVDAEIVPVSDLPHRYWERQLVTPKILHRSVTEDQDGNLLSQGH